MDRNEGRDLDPLSAKRRDGFVGFLDMATDLTCNNKLYKDSMLVDPKTTNATEND